MIDRRIKVRPAPSRAQLIALLIEERAKVICYQRHSGCYATSRDITDADRDQARREIEQEVLRRPITEKTEKHNETREKPQ